MIIKVFRKGLGYPDFVEKEAIRTIASVYKNKGPLRGLETEEEDKYLPVLLGMSKSDPAYYTKVADFWKEIRIHVPHKGLPLDMRTDSNGNPRVLKEYVYGKFLMKHPFVASSKTAMEENIEALFYYTTDEQEQLENSKITKIKKAAYKEYLNMSENPELVNFMVTLVSKPEEFHEVEKMDDDGKDTYLQNWMSANPEKFFKLAVDKNLRRKAEVEAMLKYGILENISGDYLYGEDHIGSSVSEVLAFMKSPKNSRIVMTMRLELKRKSNNKMVFTELQEEYKTDVNNEEDKAVKDEAESASKDSKVPKRKIKRTGGEKTDVPIPFTSE